MLCVVRFSFCQYVELGIMQYSDGNRKHCCYDGNLLDSEDLDLQARLLVDLCPNLTRVGPLLAQHCEDVGFGHFVFFINAQQLTLGKPPK